MKRKFISGLLFETFQPVSNSDIMILENTENHGIPKFVAKVRLQTLNERNNNNRIYETDIGDEIVNMLRPKAQKRALLQEVDHPMVPNGSDPNSPEAQFARKRSVTIQLKDCGTLLRDIYREGNDIIGVIESLSGFLGPDLYNTIIYDKADIGFSLRMFGRVVTEESTGISKVLKPIRPITYDTVTNPSHQTAKILEFLPENVNDFISPDQILTESELFKDPCVLSDNLCLECNNMSIYEYLNNVITDTFKSSGPTVFKIK